MHNWKIPNRAALFALVLFITQLFGLGLHATENAKDKISSGDLMKAMRQNLETMPAPTPAPLAVQPQPTPVPALLPTKIVQPIKKDSFESDGNPVAAAPTQTQPIISEVKEKTNANAPAPPVDGDAPLLTELKQAPTRTQMQTGVAGNNEENDVLIPAEPMPAKAEAAPSYSSGYSKSRKLFSDGARKGTVGQGLFSGSAARASVPETVPLVAKNSTATPLRDDSIEKPKSIAVAKAIPAIENKKIEGVVIHSQKAGETPTPIAPPLDTEKKIIEPTAEIIKPAEDIIAPVPPVIQKLQSSGGVQGSCGAVNGIGLTTKPVTNLCTQGTPSDVTGSGPWAWQCIGENGGGSASCSASLQINGECGMANGSQSATTPIGGLCNSGKNGDVSGNGPWYWNCFGENGGTISQCVAYTLLSGQCGPSNNIAMRTQPVDGLCNSGTASAVLGDGPWMWSCVGTGEGTNVNCTAQIMLDGMCGQASQMGSLDKPTQNLCEAGQASDVSGNGPWSWSCVGTGGGSTASCGSSVLMSGACGTAHGIGTAIKPVSDLCSTGNASDVTGNGPWNWTCYGENGGAMVNCMAPIKLDGVCGASHLAGMNTPPTDGLCSAGEASTVIGSGPWRWSCKGTGGGITTNCMAQMARNAACGGAHGISTSTPPTSDLCSSGTATTLIGSGPWMWSCQGENGGTPVDCMAPVQVSGTCGAANGMIMTEAPTANLCQMGRASNVSGNGPWNWTCQGQDGGITVSCQALKQNTQAAPVVPVPTVSTDVPVETSQAGNECVPTVKRWTITCQQGGYPTNYTGVIVGETQTLCPTGVERGVWLSNSCTPASNSMPVSPSPSTLLTPPAPPQPSSSVMDKLPDIAPLSSSRLDKSLKTPRFDNAPKPTPSPSVKTSGFSETVNFSPSSEGLDGNAVRTLDLVADYLQGDAKNILTLSAYAALPANGDQQEARRMALARALAVRTYLMRKGISSNRIDIRTLGPASDGRGNDRVDITLK